MKLQKIKKALKHTSLNVVTGEDGFQWIGDGTAFYLADRELDLTKDNLLAVLDIEEDKRSSYSVREIDWRALPQIDICPQEGNDVELNPLISVSWAGELVTIMTTAEREAVAVPQRQIAPADGKMPLRFYLRRTVDTETGEIKAPVVTVFRDMLCCAVIMPMEPRVMQEMWRVMRLACREELRSCVSDEGDNEEETAP